MGRLLHALPQQRSCPRRAGPPRSPGQRQRQEGNSQGNHASIPRGKVLAVLGANDAGKATLINALSTLIPISGGSATINGHAGPRLGFGAASPDASSAMTMSGIWLIGVMVVAGLFAVFTTTRHSRTTA
ncbi:ATP-binding cassette domain-containing protein [uncultured Corynebacterium sp.]|uniref:ATP-binding cassette domain-containing protein n=1 Tax=uncultured Corynebacterium sp. TaxID=159447 RepID=UPI00344EC9FC